MKEFIARLKAQSALSPDGIAIQCCGGEKLSYGELLEQVEKRAQELVQSRGAVNVIDLPKGTDFIIELLSTWAASYTVVILNPDFPPARKEEIRREVKTGNPDELSRAAYIIFSSGSTGKPKGVLVPPDGFLPMLEEQVEFFQLSQGDKMLWVHQVGFDASLSDIGTALISGATICLPNDELLKSPSTFFTQAHTMGITHIDIPPSLLGTLAPAHGPPTLKVLIIGGEVTPLKVIKEWSSHVRLINVYGPTEATICTSMILCSGEEVALIGPPMRHIDYAIIKDGEEAGEGELHIYGKSVALGYLNQPDLTASRFYEFKGLRTFRTGDKVRLRKDGSLQFLGRIDRQIKVNGCLISPEEIERELLALPEVTRAHVALLEGRIHGWLETQCDIDLSEVKKDLSKSLPTWMIPTRLHQSRELPTLSNLKIDAHSLKAEVNEDSCQKITRWMRAAIPDASYQSTENFFTSGGDSLATLRLLSIAAEEGEELSYETLRAHPSAEKLASATAVPALSTRYLKQQVKKELAKLPAVTGSPVSTSEEILLTGATGFFGSALLGMLICDGHERVTCLVRGDLKQQQERISLALKRHGFKVSLSSVKLVAGDLAQDQFGLNHREWDYLSSRHWKIIHAAAEVHVLKSFTELENVNLGGTRRVLELLHAGAENTLVYLSTLSVFVDATPLPIVCQEDDFLDFTQVVHGGYAQSKWAAEKLILSHAPSLNRSKILRLGLLTPNSESGFAPDHDLFRAYLRSDFTHSPMHEEMDFSPVDIAASHTVKLLKKGSCGKVYHLANETSLKVADLKAVLGNTSPNSQNPYQALQENSSSTSHLKLLKTGQTSFSCENTQRDLKEAELFPRPSREYLRTYLAKIL